MRVLGMVTDKMLEKIIEYCRLEGAEMVALFGSCLRSEQNPASDMKLLYGKR